MSCYSPTILYVSQYVDALAASQFGATPPPENDSDNGAAPSSNSNNIDSLVLPVLCNLSACSLQLSLWGQAIQFAEQALFLRPNCHKALYRQGIAYLRVHEYERSVNCFKKAQTDREKAILPLTNEELNKLKDYEKLALQGVQKDKKQLQAQKAALRKAFNWTISTSECNQINKTHRNAETLVEPLSLWEFIVFIMGYIYQTIIKLFLPCVYKKN